MGAQVIDGKAFASRLRERVGEQAAKFESAAGRKAGLDVAPTTGVAVGST